MRNKKIIVSLATLTVIAMLIALISSFAFAQTEIDVTEIPEVAEVAEVTETEDEDRVCPVTGEPCTGESYGPMARRQDRGEIPGIGEQNRQRLRDESCSGDPEAAAERQQQRRDGQGRGKNRG